MQSLQCEISVKSRTVVGTATSHTDIIRCKALVTVFIVRFHLLSLGTKFVIVIQQFKDDLHTMTN